MIRVTYPNEGLYAAGQPRWEQTDKAGQITFSRLATDHEAMTYGLMDSIDSLRYAADELAQKVQEAQTYGVRWAK